MNSEGKTSVPNAREKLSPMDFHFQGKKIQIPVKGLRLSRILGQEFLGR